MEQLFLYPWKTKWIYWLNFFFQICHWLHANAFICLGFKIKRTLSRFRSHSFIHSFILAFVIVRLESTHYTPSYRHLRANLNLGIVSICTSKRYSEWLKQMKFPKVLNIYCFWNRVLLAVSTTVASHQLLCGALCILATLWCGGEQLCSKKCIMFHFHSRLHSNTVRKPTNTKCTFLYTLLCPKKQWNQI